MPYQHVSSTGGPPPYVAQRWTIEGYGNWCVVFEGQYYPFGSRESCQGIIDICTTEEIRQYSTWSQTYPYNPVDGTLPHVKSEEEKRFEEQQKALQFYKAELGLKLGNWHHINTNVDMSDNDYPTIAITSPQPDYRQFRGTGTPISTAIDGWAYNSRGEIDMDTSELLQRQVRGETNGDAGVWDFSAICGNCGHDWCSTRIAYICPQCGGQSITNSARDRQGALLNPERY